MRKDFKELNKGLIQDLQTSVPQELGKYNASDHIFHWINGSKTFFGHCENLAIKDLNLYLSAGFSFIGIDEAGEFPFEIWDFLVARNRNRVPGPTPRMGLATNPYGIGWGWIKKLFIDKRPVPQLEGAGTYKPEDYFWNHSTIFDNPFQLAKDPGYVERLNRQSPGLRKIMLEGDINSTAGQYFSNFSEARHVIKMEDLEERIEWEEWQQSWAGSDWGLGHFWTTFWMRQSMVLMWNGEWKRCCIVYRELVERNRSIADYAERLAEKNAGDKLKRIFYSPERFNRTEPLHTPADQFSQELRSHGLPSVTRASNYRVAGATFLYSKLEADEIVILDCCPNLIHAIPSLVNDPTDPKDVLKPSTPSIEDDCYDGWRYGVVSMLAPKAEPFDVTFQEELAQIPDPTSRAIHAQRLIAQQRERIRRDGMDGCGAGRLRWMRRP